MSANDRLPETTPGGRAGLFLAAFLRGLARLLVILFVAGALVAVFYFGVPALYRWFITPVERNAERLEGFQTSQEGANRQLAQRLDRLQENLNALETRSVEDTRTIATLQAQLEEAQGALDASLEASESDLTGAIGRIEALDEGLQDVQAGLDRLAVTQRAGAARQRTLDDQEAAAEQAVAASMDDLRRELELVKAMELLLRSRLYLGQSNFGLAGQDIQTARDLLAGVRLQAPAYQAPALDAILSRLDLALGNLPERPVIAADDLEIAWQILVQGLPGEGTPEGPLSREPAGIFTGTPTITATGEVQATATHTPWLTETAELTGTPASTPTVEERLSPTPAITPTKTSSP
jgi:hypothetical protein